MSAGFLGPDAVRQLREIARRVLREEIGSSGLGGAGSFSTGLVNYVIKTSTAGITARSTDTPGSGTGTIFFRSTGNTLTSFSTETVTIYNSSTSTVGGSQYIQVSQDEFGSLWSRGVLTT